MRRLARLALISFVFFGFFAGSASAETSQAVAKGVAISPPLKEVIIGPGLLQAHTDITVTNNSDHDVSGTIKAVDFKALDEFGGVSLGQAGIPVSKYGLANWMTIDGSSDLSLAKGQSRAIRVNIDNRGDLAPGGHYGAVVVTVAEASPEAGNKVSLKQELVSLIFVKKTGGEKLGLQLLSMGAKTGSGIPSTVDIRFKSTGNVHVVPRGYVNITDPRGKLVAKGIINPESTMILPDTTRKFVTVMDPVTESSLRGQYKVTAYYRYDGVDKFSSASFTFSRGSWISSQTLLLILTGVILLLTGIALYRAYSGRAYRVRH